MIPFQSSGCWCIDNVKGGAFLLDLARDGRKGEIEGFAARRLCDISSSMCSNTKRFSSLGSQVVFDTLKGSKVWSRQVRQEFNTTKGRFDEMFAVTAPLLASRCHNYDASTLMMLGFSKAFMYGDMEVYMELPEEDARRAKGDFVGFLRKNMCARRDAPTVWQVVQHMFFTTFFF